MRTLSDQLLIDTYLAAVHYKCEHEFIQMLAMELKLRGIQVPEQQFTA